MYRIIIFLIAVSTIISCTGKKQEENTATTEAKPVTTKSEVALTDAQVKSAGIVTDSLSSKNISSVLKLSGKIDVPPQNMVSVSVPMGGYVKSTKLLPGMHISKGESLAVIEDPQYIQLQQDYLTAKAEFAYNKAEYERQKELNQSKASSDKVLEQATAAYQTKNVLINALEQKLKLIGLNPAKITATNITKSINIYSPINGFVSAVNVNIGKYVNPADVLFELVNPSDIHLALTVFEKDINKLSIGQKLFAYTNTNPEKKYPCEIVLISKSLSDDRATEVHCHFEQYDKTLIPGMFMNADVEVSSNNSRAIPDEAIVRFENKQYVFVSKAKNTFSMVEVESGNTENGYTEIKNDSVLKNQLVVTKGSYSLLMALKNTSEE